MKLAAILLAAFTLSACSEDSRSDGPGVPGNPVAPPVPIVPSSPPIPNASAWLWGFVVNGSGVCIEGATVRVVRGQREGESVVQSTPCDAWGYGGGFYFDKLTPGVEMTLRASAPGYADAEVTMTPHAGSQSTFTIVPTPRSPINRSR
jgi:hypothetical protein